MVKNKKTEVFAKDISFFPDEFMQLEVVRDVFRNSGNSSGAIRLLSPVFHAKYGSQLWVSKEVSDDLEQASITEFDFGSLEWPRKNLEVVFEDPSIPSLLTQRYTQNEFNEKLSDILKMPSSINLSFDSGEVFNAIIAECKDRSFVSVLYPDEAMNELAAYEVPVSKNDGGLHDVALNELEKRTMQEMVVLFYKVILFACSSGCEPRLTDQIPSRKQGGKPGYKNRPKKDRLVIEYLPHHYKERQKQAREAGHGTHEFRGRRGHWRHYKAARYKAMQGQRQFIFPVPGPDGTVPKHKFVVRNPA